MAGPHRLGEPIECVLPSLCKEEARTWGGKTGLNYAMLLTQPVAGFGRGALPSGFVEASNAGAPKRFHPPVFFPPQTAGFLGADLKRFTHQEKT
jgi:hypothetical protein